MSSLLKNLLGLGSIIVVIVIGYILLSGSTGDMVGDGGFAVDPMVEITLKTEKILADTQKINQYKLDVSLFTDSRFRSLTDLGVEINDVRTGRNNPFLPIYPGQ